MPTILATQHHDQVIAIIAQMNAGGTIPLSGFEGLLSTALPANEAKILASGTLIIDKSNETFDGKLPAALSIKEDGITLTDPEEVKGAAKVSPDGFELDFSGPAPSLSKKLWIGSIGAHLTTIIADAKTVKLGFSNTMFNTTIQHG